ncbi:hypothetical protein O6H91_06G046600 [Diphasiastrum complanatum]|uniref:Uncharacterized protein n=1 Tax=Diphasiastrum complanatum TaxID=34168 RepID=A0ACC2DDC9_DIPCM|nr:hypothetical protein O6H91_06G046600 [Diphasiastrum complanatum]
MSRLALILRLGLLRTTLLRFIHIPPNSPRTDWNTSYSLPWWKDPDYIIGKLSERTRSLRIKNVLIDQEVLLEVPSQEKISQIVERYTALNSHAESYTWKASCVTQRKEFLQLDMDKTLTENGILDEVEEFVALGLPEDFYVPVIHIYYNDDLTIS